MPIRKFTNGRFSLKRFTAPGVGGGGALPLVNVYANATLVFTDTTTWFAPSNLTKVDYMIIGGGGGGGTEGGGGGGAGGYRYGTDLPVIANQTYTIVVGGGGTGGPFSPSDGGATFGTNGTNSGIFSTAPFSAIWSTGGGGGSSYRANQDNNGYSGGSGGGAAIRDSGGNSFGGLGTPGQGFNGAAGPGGAPSYLGGGGGGGAGGAGYSASPAQIGGNGGIGIFNTISGSNVAYAGGGAGGGHGSPGTSPGGWGGNGYAPYGVLAGTPFGGGNGGWSRSTNGFAANTNTGGGGGGGGDSGSGSYPVVSPSGGRGGSGIVILKYSYLQSSTGTVYWNQADGSVLRNASYVQTLEGPITANIDAFSLTGSLVFSLASGSLPTGLSLLANGVVTGTATPVTQDTTNTFTVLATNTTTGYNDQRNFTITIKAPVVANYNYTGADQTFTLPATVNTFIVHAWGGGGGAFPGSPYVGGGGGYTTGIVKTTAGNSFVVVVGQGGDSRGPNAGVGPYIRYGGGGQITPLGWGGQGGGLSGIFTGTGTVFSGVTAQPGAQARAVLIAGGGGGSGDYGQGGEGGGLSGNNSYALDGSTYAPYGAGLQTPSNNGYNGSPQAGGALSGGNAGGGDNGGGGGGGAGYYGGGGGTGENGVPNAGGGGSGYVGGAPGITISAANSKNAFKTTSANGTSVYYANNAGRGGSQTIGDNGRVVIIY